jgi:enoyl-CoA hydratase/3-hydroxyacyl-CoA dehydrogenase
MDRVMIRFGLPMGVFRLGDLVGVDITSFIDATYTKAWPDRVYTSQLTSLLVRAKRLGQKTGKGWYAHAKGKAIEDPSGLQPILDQSRRHAGLAREFPLMHLSSPLCECHSRVLVAVCV